MYTVLKTLVCESIFDNAFAEEFDRNDDIAFLLDGEAIAIIEGYFTCELA
jgi:hypothetical protein